MRRYPIPLLVLVLAGAGACATPPAATAPAEAPAPTPVLERARPVPYPVQPPATFQHALAQGTRTADGEPGPQYWEQWVDYDIDARVDAETKTLTGSEAVVYHNNAPNPLPLLVLNLTQNFHAEGAIRNELAEVTGGVNIERVTVNGQELGPTTSQRTPGWAVQGTLMYIVLPEPVQPASTVKLGLDWSFTLPQAGASGRMGYSQDQLLYLGYWFPQLAVYDDVIGWHADPFRGGAEFYSDFGHYHVSVDAPAGWLVMSTGALENADAVLKPEVAARLRRAATSDDVVHVVTHEQAPSATLPGTGGRLTWEFDADSVRDVAFAVMRQYAWDAARTPVGDRDGDGTTDYARVDAFWRQNATNYVEAAEFAQNSITFLSRFTGLSYPWPHMSVVEGGGIIGGGMEYPMMTLIGSYTQQPSSALYSVIVHELGHMWIPMTLSSNERRYAWLDEGTTSFNEDNARMERYPDTHPFEDEQAAYTALAKTGMEGPIMRWSDFQYPGPAYGIASYAKPASVLHALRGVLGEDAFMRAYHAFYDRWAFRHPYPWDLFNTVENVTGEDLGWFWRSWYYESTSDGKWYLDQAVASVEQEPDGQATITIRDLGWIPMPVLLQVTRADGTTEQERIPVERWLTGADRASLTVPAGAEITAVEIDPEHYFPDVDRSNNVWTGG